jgi:hypothetical protein
MSLSRHCAFYKATNDKWYMELGDKEYAFDDSECTTYGPFNSLELAEKELDNHANPGSVWMDETIRPVPVKSGNGGMIKPPRSRRRF